MPHSGKLIDNPEMVGRRVHGETKNDSVDEQDPEYDVVVIGGGTAGCVVASRLSEDPNVRVLLLEAGGSSMTYIFSRIPATYTAFMHTNRDYDLWTEPQVHANNKKKYWPRGKLLGGCSAINAMMYHHGAPTDYDDWARICGSDEWSYKNFSKYFLKFEKFTPDKRYPDVDPTLRGAKGPVSIGYFGYLSKSSKNWIDACVNLGIPKNPDINTSRGTMGVTKIMAYIDKRGRRVSTEAAYLTPEVLKRPNLKVSIYSQVTRVLFDMNGDTKRAVGVEFARSKDGPRYRVRVKKEVIVSAGAVHSPHILLLSGVGPKDELEKHKIPLVHDLSGVGKNLEDHAVVNTIVSLKPGHSLQFLTAKKVPHAIRTLGEFVKWSLFGKGPLTSNAGEVAAFCRLDDPKLFSPDKYEIKEEASSLEAPDLEALMVPLGYTEHGHGPVPKGELITMSAILLRPQSKGTVGLNSANPFNPPKIDPKVLESPSDLGGLVRGLKLLIKIANTEPFASSMKEDKNPLLDHGLEKLTDVDLEDEVRKRVETLYHPTSTCRMAKLEDDGVVDTWLRVYGLENVRVADASIFPRIVAGHTSAPSIAVGEKAADIVKATLSNSI